KYSQTNSDVYESCTVERTTLSYDLVDNYSTHSDYEAIPQASMIYLKMNQTINEALENTNIRAAISRAFNKEELVDQILNNGSLVANGLVPEEFTTVPGSDESFREASGDLVEYDIDEAQDYWDKGLEELGED